MKPLDHHIRGFNPGDDEKLQKALKGNLKKAHDEKLDRGEHESASGTKKHLDALDELAKINRHHDPDDKEPDHDLKPHPHSHHDPKRKI